MIPPRSALLRLSILVVAALSLACETNASAERRRRRAEQTKDLTDTSLRMDVRVPFQAPPGWEHVSLEQGLEFTQPPGFTIVNAPEIRCDSVTLADTIPVLRAELSNSWPLTLAMRRGDPARIARANGFTTDSTDIATHGQLPGETTVVRRGEGWQLLSGRSAGTSVLLASVRAPNGCYLLWAGRGVEIDVDTLGLVIGTVRFVGDSSAGAQPAGTPEPERS